MALVLPFHSENEVHCDIVRDYAERPSGDYGEPGCQSHVAHALWGVGIPTLPINFMPQILYGQLLLRQAGIYASPILINR